MNLEVSIPFDVMLCHGVIGDQLFLEGDGSSEFDFQTMKIGQPCCEDRTAML
jgi:hypothetical protein